MHSIASAVVKAGILPEETLAEFRRWGFQVETPAILHKGPEEVVQAIEEALQEEGLVLTRETDLELVRFYLETQAPGVLHIVVENPEADMAADIECTYGVTPLGEYVIRWHSESIEDVMCNGKTHLLVNAAGGSKAVYFDKVREAFFGDTKAFIVCRASLSEPVTGSENSNG